MRRQNTRGLKTYELTNHLGNVLATVTDARLGVDSDSDGDADYYHADIASAADYYPFGFGMPERSYSNGSEYRFGFNGKENDGNQIFSSPVVNFGARLYNPALARWISLDPLSDKYPSYSDYSSMNNNPILIVDPTGKGGEISNLQLSRGSSPGNVNGTADLVVYVNLYIDPNMNYTGDLASDISHQIGSPNQDGTWTIDAGTGPIMARVEGVGNVELQVNAKIVVSVISNDEAQARIQTETNQAQNYYRIVSQPGEVGGHNMAGSNQGVIYSGTLYDSRLDEVLIHEPWHSLANGYPDPQYPEDQYTRENPLSGYGLHNRSGLMDGDIQEGERLDITDFDAIKPNYPYTSYGSAPQYAIGIRRDGTIRNSRGEVDPSIGGGINNTPNLSNDELREITTDDN